MPEFSEEVLESIQCVIEMVENGDQFCDVNDIVELVLGEIEENFPEEAVDRSVLQQYLEELFYKQTTFN